MRTTLLKQKLSAKNATISAGHVHLIDETEKYDVAEQTPPLHDSVRLVHANIVFDSDPVVMPPPPHNPQLF